MQIRHWVRTDVVTVDPDDELTHAAQLMIWNGIRQLPVTADRRLVGMIGDRELLSRRVDVGTLLVGRVGDVMTLDPVSIGSDAEVAHALARFVDDDYGVLPVLDNERLVGVITTRDLLAQLVRMQGGCSRTGSLEWSAQSLMTRDVAVVFEDDLLVDAGARMQQYGVRHLPVIDGMRRVVGMLSERDLLSAIGDFRRLRDEPMGKIHRLRVRDVMTADPRWVHLADSLCEVVDILARERFGALPVVDDQDRLSGMISYIDVLRLLQRGR